jgi:hypothetical protein
MDEKLKELVDTLNKCFGPSEFTKCNHTEVLEQLANSIDKLVYQTTLQNQIIADFLIDTMKKYKQMRNFGETDIENTIEQLKKLK